MDLFHVVFSARLLTKHPVWRAKRFWVQLAHRYNSTLCYMWQILRAATWSIVSYEQWGLHNAFINLSSAFNSVDRDSFCTKLDILAKIPDDSVSSVTQSCPGLCDPVDCSMPGFPVHHQLLEPTQTHIHHVDDAIQPSNPLFFTPSILPRIRVFSSESVLRIRWPKYWSFSFSISPSNEYSGLIFFRIDWLDFLAVQGIVKSLLQHHSSKAINSLVLSFLYSPTLTSIHDYWKNQSFD